MYDIEETKRRGYSGKSKVFFDGREVLKGKDWKNRKLELWQRAGGRCERIVDLVNGVRCRSQVDDPHHLVKRSRGRDDRLSNLQGLCRLHHDFLDPRKPRWGAAS